MITNQITHLNIDIKYRMLLILKIALEIFESILSLCKNLTTFNFGDMLFIFTKVCHFLFYSTIKKQHLFNFNETQNQR